MHGFARRAGAVSQFGLNGFKSENSGYCGARDGGEPVNLHDFEIAVGEAAQDAVWKTEHPLTHHLAEDDPRREQYRREYQQSVGRKVLAAIMTLVHGCSSDEVNPRLRCASNPCPWCGCRAAEPGLGR
jgi:hypothetical protein